MAPFGQVIGMGGGEGILRRIESGSTMNNTAASDNHKSIHADHQAAAAADRVTLPQYQQQQGQQEGGQPYHHDYYFHSQILENLPQFEVKIGFEQRWLEKTFLVSYILDAIVGVVYDRVLLPRPEGTKRPVLLVPGWCGRTKSFRKMADRLEKEGHPVYPVPLGSQLGCIDRKAGLISHYLDTHNLDDVYVVAHSMGGLITVRSMMKGEKRIRRLITMGTPYRGTHVIYLGYSVTVLATLALCLYLSPIVGSIFLGLFMQIPSLWQMQPSSRFLNQVLDYLAKTPTPVQCIYAIRDQIVIHNWRQAWDPTRLGRLDDLCLPEHGHMNLFMGDSGVELITHLLAKYETVDASLAMKQEKIQHKRSKSSSRRKVSSGSVALAP